MPLKREVQDFWERAACGEEAYLGEVSAEGYRRQAEIRYRLEPYILDFARFDRYRGKRVLEIGVGLGADHQQFAEAGAVLTGTDFTSAVSLNAFSTSPSAPTIFGLCASRTMRDASRIMVPIARRSAC